MFVVAVSLLRKPATYAGNDALVAFAHLYNVTIVIHQLDTAMFKIDKGGVPSARELHLAYHNGEHYSSVRRVGDKSRQPANIRIRQVHDRLILTLLMVATSDTTGSESMT